MEHTPGPWRVEGNAIWAGRGTNARLIIPEGDKLERKYFLSMLPKEEVEANLHLASCAPELLEALKHAKYVLLTDGNTDENGNSHGITKVVLTRIENAIAKAEGGCVKGE